MYGAALKGHWSHELLFLRTGRWRSGPTILAEFRPRENFCTDFYVVASKIQVLSIHVFLVHLTMINQNVCVKLLKQSIDSFPSGLFLRKFSVSSPFSKTNRNKSFSWVGFCCCCSFFYLFASIFLASTISITL